MIKDIYFQGVNECLWLGSTCVGVHGCVLVCVVYVYGDQTCSLPELYR